MTRGRPKGASNYLAYRVRHWYWMGVVIECAGLPLSEAIWNLPPDHPLLHGLQRWGAFESVVRDGADPGKVLATEEGKSLLEHVSATEAYREAREAYSHRLWPALRDNVLPADIQEWLERILPSFGLIRITQEDLYHALCLGLLRFGDKRMGTRRDVREIVVNWKDFLSLDGILALVALAGEAWGVAHHKQANHFARSARFAALALGQRLHFNLEAQTSWMAELSRFLSAPRWPAAPSAHEHLTAESQILPDMLLEVIIMGRPPPWPPEASLKETKRLERLLQAQIQANRYAGLRDVFLVRTADVLWRWLVDNRLSLRSLMSQAVLQAEGKPNAMFSARPIAMPRSLYMKRTRPHPIDMERKHFGDLLPYDLVPVMDVPD